MQKDLISLLRVGRVVAPLTLQSGYDLFFALGAVLPQYGRGIGVYRMAKRLEDNRHFSDAHSFQFWQSFDQHPGD